MERTTLAIHFEDRSGNEFERLTFAFVSRQKSGIVSNGLGKQEMMGAEIFGDSFTKRVIVINVPTIVT